MPPLQHTHHLFARFLPACAIYRAPCVRVNTAFPFPYTALLPPCLATALPVRVACCLPPAHTLPAACHYHRGLPRRRTCLFLYLPPSAPPIPGWMMVGMVASGPLHRTFLHTSSPTTYLACLHLPSSLLYLPATTTCPALHFARGSHQRLRGWDVWTGHAVRPCFTAWAVYICLWIMCPLGYVVRMSLTHPYRHVHSVYCMMRQCPCASVRFSAATV